MTVVIYTHKGNQTHDNVRSSSVVAKGAAGGGGQDAVWGAKIALPLSHRCDVVDSHPDISTYLNSKNC